MKVLSKKLYYSVMENMCKDTSFNVLHKNWLNCFKYILHSWKVGYTDKICEDLFYHFDMINWEQMWLENSKYKNCSKEELISYFCADCSYIADRTSYDRLFRTHWLFLKSFPHEINKIKHPRLYTE